VTQGRLAPAIVGVAGVGLGIALYLLLTRVAGGVPVCQPGGGCETVALSEYSTFLGLPVALYGLGYSIVLVGLALIWWRSGDRRALLALYGLGFLGVLVIAYLTYLEVFVIEAICVWCVAYGVTVVVTFALAAAGVIRTRGSGTIG
jgi:uncharacterized membrane protein